jgi:hypothetical protein
MSASRRCAQALRGLAAVLFATFCVGIVAALFMLDQPLPATLVSLAAVVCGLTALWLRGRTRSTADEREEER